MGENPPIVGETVVQPIAGLPATGYVTNLVISTFPLVVLIHGILHIIIILQLQLMIRLFSTILQLISLLRPTLNTIKIVTVYI